MKSVYEIKKEICEVGHIMYELGFVAANDGNISVKVGENEYYCTPTGVSKRDLTPDMIIKVDKNGRKETAYVVTFVEHPEGYTWAGGCLKKFIEAYHEEFLGTKLVVGDMVKTKSNNDYRVFEVYDDTSKKTKKKQLNKTKPHYKQIIVGLIFKQGGTYGL